MSDRSIDDLADSIRSFFDYVDEAAYIGAEDAADLLQATTEATDRYKNLTGATRASTLAYVAGRDDDRAEEARAAGEALNPGESVAETVAAEDDQAITIPITVFMRYDDPLEVRTGFIAHATETAAEPAAAAIFEAIGEAFE